MAESLSDQNEFHDEYSVSGDDGRGVRQVAPPKGSDQACSYPFFFGLLFMAIIILAVTLGVTLSDEKQTSTASGVNQQRTNTPTSTTTPVASPIATPTVAPQHALTPAEMTTEEYLRYKCNAWSGSDVDQIGTPAHLAFDWLTTIDPKDLGKESSERDIRQRYISAVIYFAMQGQYWQERRRKLQDIQTIFGFLSGADVCDWNANDMGIFCNGERNIEIIRLCKFHQLVAKPVPFVL